MNYGIIFLHTSSVQGCTGVGRSMQVESDRKKKRQNVFDCCIMINYISEMLLICFLKQILSAFICRTLYFSSMFSLGAMSDFVERGKFCAWQNSSKFSRNF